VLEVSQPSQSPDTSHANDIQTPERDTDGQRSPVPAVGWRGFEPAASSSRIRLAMRMLHGSAEDYVRNTYGRWASGPHARLWARQGAGIGRSRGGAALRLYLKACEAIFVRGAARLYRIGQERRDKPLTLLR
jgi:hypothetical protein